MKYFSEFYRILEKFHEPRIETVDREFRGRKKSKEFRLYEGIGSGLFPNDSAAAGTLYEFARPDAPKFSSLKNRLKVRMLNSLFHLNLKRAGFSDAAQAFYIAHRRMFMVVMLNGLGASTAARRMAETTLDLANRYELTNVALEMARLLRQYASDMGHTKQFDYYNGMLKSLLARYSDELESTEYFERINSIFNREAGGRIHYAEEFQGYEANLRGKLNPASSYNFQLHYHRVRTLAALSSGIASEVIKGSRAGIEFLESKPDKLQKARIADFWFYQLVSHLGTHDYELAQEAANQCALFYNEGSNSWFAYAEAKFLLLMNTLKIGEAEDFFRNVTSHERFAYQSEISRQHWDIFRFYLTYAQLHPEDKEHSKIPEAARLNYDILLKSRETRRDKVGMNMLIRFAHALYLIDYRKYGEMDNVMRDLDHYRNQHTDASKTEQSSLFAGLLRTMVKQSYRYRDCVTHGKGRYEKLKTRKFEIIDLDQEIQVLPYTWLWDRILERLKENERITR